MGVSMRLISGPARDVRAATPFPPARVPRRAWRRSLAVGGVAAPVHLQGVGSAGDPEALVDEALEVLEVGRAAAVSSPTARREVRVQQVCPAVADSQDEKPAAALSFTDETIGRRRVLAAVRLAPDDRVERGRRARAGEAL